MIRPARRDDVAAIDALIRELAAFHRHPDAVTASADDLAAALFAEQPQVFALVAEEDGRVVGAAIWFVTYSTWTGRHGIHLEDLVVSSAARGQGHGAALVGELRRIAEERGYRRVDWQVLDWNERGMRFYRGIGGAPVDGSLPWRLPVPPPRPEQDVTRR